MEKNFIKENWSTGKLGGIVITDTPEGLPENSGHSGDGATDYYGGSLICESIWRKKDVLLIASAPKLLRFAIQVAAKEGWQQAFDLVEEALGHPVSLNEMVSLHKLTEQ